MATMHPNKSFIYKKYTQYVPKPGEDMTVESRPFDLESAPPPGGITVKNLYLSLDPYQRGQMRGPGYEGTYSFPWELDEPVVITTLAVVLKTDNPQFKPNDLVCGMAPAAEFAAVSAEFAAATRVIPQIPGVNISPATLVGAMGISGLSAYQGFYEYIKEPREGQTIFITAASGGVGQVIGQLAKMHGMKVIGSTGSQEKVDFVTKELGFDAAWNYKTESTTECLTKFAPEGLDVLYENVGGEQLETALTHMKDFGQVVLSGLVHDYNLPINERYGVRTLIHVIWKRLSVNAFICSDPPILNKYMDRFATDMVKYLAEGKIKTKEHMLVGIDKAPEGFVRMLDGNKFGKMVVKVDEE